MTSESVQMLFAAITNHLRTNARLRYTWGWDTRPMLRLHFLGDPASARVATELALRAQGLDVEHFNEMVLVRVPAADTAAN